MNIIEMKLKGGVWKVIMAADTSALRQHYTMARQGKETLADAAARLEDILRQLKTSQLKPLSLAG